MKKTSFVIAAAALAASGAFAQQPSGHCDRCGVVQSVQKVERTEKAKGIGGTAITPGTAVGGLVGGVLGNQIGGGGAATVLGAAGGAYAGHEIERHNRKYVAYVMRIKMDDGSMRTIEQRTPIARGSHVLVEGHTARLERPGRNG